MQPYFYLVRNRNNGKLYAGSQYGRHANPCNLLNTYFTSCKDICNNWSDFDIIYIKPRADARKYESRWLGKVYRKLGREKFLDVFINRNIAPGILNTPEIIAKANVGRKISNKRAAEERIKNGTHNFQLNKYKHSEEWKIKIKARMKSDLNPSKDPEVQKKRITDNFRKKQAEGSKGNTNVLGYKWWTNGLINKRAKECPGENFYRGIIKING
jgi:hypothetical protein